MSQPFDEHDTVSYVETGPLQLRVKACELEDGIWIVKAESEPTGAKVSAPAEAFEIWKPRKPAP